MVRWVCGVSAGDEAGGRAREWWWEWWGGGGEFVGMGALSSLVRWYGLVHGFGYNTDLLAADHGSARYRLCRCIGLKRLHRCCHGLARRRTALDQRHDRVRELPLCRVTWSPFTIACVSPAELDVARPLKQAFDRVSNLQPCTTHVAELVVVLPLWYFICWWVGPLAVSSALASTVAKAWDCHISCAVCTG